MNRLHQLEGCAPRQYVGRNSRIEAALRCYGGGSSSSSTPTTTTYQQATLDTGGAAGVNVGSGASTGAINITSGDVQTAQMALSGASNFAAQAIVTSAEHAEHAESIVGSIAGDAVTAQQQTAAQANLVVGNIAGQAIQTGAATAQSLGGAAINAGTVMGTAALQYGQNVTALNLNALNQNTALAFSTIAALDTARASGETSGAAADLARLASQIGSQSGGPPTTIYIPSQSPAYTGQTASGGLDATTVLIIAGIAVAAMFILKK